MPLADRPCAVWMEERSPEAAARRTMTSSSDGLRAPFALARVRDESGEHFLGLVAGGRIRALSPLELGAPDLNAFLAAGDSAWDRLEQLAGGADDEHWIDLASVTLTAPVTPRQVLQTG